MYKFHETLLFFLECLSYIIKTVFRKSFEIAVFLAILIGYIYIYGYSEFHVGTLFLNEKLYENTFTAQCTAVLCYLLEFLSYFICGIVPYKKMTIIRVANEGDGWGACILNFIISILVFAVSIAFMIGAGMIVQILIFLGGQVMYLMIGLFGYILSVPINAVF